MKLITGYESPDLDGLACIVGYMEYLQKKGVEAEAKIYGNLQEESRFLLKKYNFSLPKNGTYTPGQEVILVDASDLHGLNNEIDPKDVREIIDHRKINDSHMFPNAKVQIEPIGAAASLIVEKYAAEDMEISEMAAKLLYGAIASNTLNFKANVTTERDRKMASWLNEKLQLNESFVEEMFEAKSDFSGDKLTNEICDQTAVFDRAGIKMSISQLEIVGAKKLVCERKAEIIELLKALSQEKNIEMNMLSVIDLKDDFNLFLTADEKMKRLLTKVFGVKFDGDVARRDGLIMRKEIVPLLVEEIEKG